MDVEVVIVSVAIASILVGAVRAWQRAARRRAELDEVFRGLVGQRVRVGVRAGAVGKAEVEIPVEATVADVVGRPGRRVVTFRDLTSDVEEPAWMLGTAEVETASRDGVLLDNVRWIEDSDGRRLL